MSLFISDAWAQASGGSGQGDALGFFLPLVLIFALFYFIAIRPQQKRAKEHRKMVESLQKGDEVVTTGGILGRITEVSDNFITLDVANGVQIKVQRHAVHAVMPKGTAKSA
jgi:preprotein translocase subunit YajC